MFTFPSDPYLEESPKWLALQDVLSEIEEENNRMKEEHGGEMGRVLVAASDDRTCDQIKEVNTIYFTITIY